MPKYVAFLRGTEDAQSGLSPDEAQRTLERYMAWSAELERAGKLVDGGGLSASQSRVLRKAADDVLVSDGPFAESTEIVGGFLVIEAADLDEAEKIYSDHPHLDFGSMEVRKVGEAGCEP